MIANYLRDYSSFSSVSLLSLCTSLCLGLSLDALLLVKKIQNSKVENMKTKPSGWLVFRVFPIKVLNSAP